MRQLRSAHVYFRNSVTKFRIGDVVLLKDEIKPRLLWKLARISKIYSGRDGRVQLVKFDLPIVVSYVVQINSFILWKFNISAGTM